MKHLGINEIKEILPHRHPFLLVDYIEDYEPGEYAVGYKCVTYREDFFAGHFPQEPVILPATEATIGILPMHCLGEILDVTKVHRMEKFTAITGLEPGDVMTEKAYLQLITAENGLFGHSLGSRWLVLNRVNDPQLYQSAKKIAEAAVTSGVIDGWIAGCLENE